MLNLDFCRNAEIRCVCFGIELGLVYVLEMPPNSTLVDFDGHTSYFLQVVTSFPPHDQAKDIKLKEKTQAKYYPYLK